MLVPEITTKRLSLQTNTSWKNVQNVRIIPKNHSMADVTFAGKNTVIIKDQYYMSIFFNNINISRFLNGFIRNF